MDAPWDLSCKDWADRLAAGKSLVPDLPLWSDGDRAVAMYRKLRLADVPGTPTIAEANGDDDWFGPVVRAMFGSLNPATKQRMIRELFALVPKKNAKTTYGALGLMLVGLLMNERPRAPFGMAAPVKDVADLAFEAIVGAIELDPVLDKLFHRKHHTRTIIHRQTKAYLQVMAFDPQAATGTRWAGFLLDEIHVIAKQGKAPSALRQIVGGMVQYPEAFLAKITTQSEEEPTGIFRSDLQRARAVRDGRKSYPVLPVLYEFPEAMQKSRDKVWRDPKFWPMVTPNLGKSITLERLIEEFTEEEEKGEAELRAWASQHLNIEIGLALQANGWAGAERWEEQGTKLSLDDVLLRSEVVTIGIDGGGLDDLFGLTVMGREAVTGNWLAWSHAWAHPILLERHKQQAERFRDFEAEGSMTIVEKIGDDIAQVVAVVRKCEKSGLLERIGVDPEGIAMLVDAIVAEENPDAPNGGGAGIERERIVGIPQGWKLVGPIKACERKLADHTLFHDDSSLMKWCVGNAIVEPRGNAITITKATCGSAKIDPLMSLLDSAALMALNPAPRALQYQFLVY